MRKIGKTVIFFLLLGILFLAVQMLLLPKWRYPVDLEEHLSRVEEYHSIRKDSVQVLFAGTSHVMYGVDPMQIYQESGIVSYNLGCSLQRMATMYYQLADAFDDQSPKVVMVDASSLYLDLYFEPAWRHLLDLESYLSGSRLAASLQFSGDRYLSTVHEIPNSLFAEWDEKLGYWFDAYFSFFANHTRWDELSQSDFEIMPADRYYSKGYLFRPDAVPADSEVDEINKEAYEKQTETGQEELIIDRGERIVNSRSSEPYNYLVNKEQAGWLEKIRQLCAEHGARLVLIKIPVQKNIREYSSSWTKLKSEEIKKIASQMNISFLDLMYDTDIHIDGKQDYYDGGSHLNFRGAEKVSDYLASYLTKECGLEGQKNAYYDSGMRWYRKLNTVKELIRADQWSEYIKALHKRSDGKTILLALNSTDDQFSMEDWNELKTIGVETPYHQDMSSTSYVGVIQDGKSVYEVSGRLPATVEFPLNSKSVADLKSVSDIWLASEPGQASIQLDHEEKTENSPGLNIIVYDNDTQTIIDRVSFCKSSADGTVECRRDWSVISGDLLIYLKRLYNEL